MICPENIEKIAHAISDLTDLDPVAVSPYYYSPIARWIIEGSCDGKIILRMSLTNSGKMYAAWDPNKYLDILHEHQVI